MDTLLSIIIPVYNVQSYIVRCLDSIYSAGCNKALFEVIVIDDGSTDSSLKILEEYNEPNLIVIHQSNHGVSVARNVGLEIAKAKYVTFIDPDDFLENGSLEKIINILRNLVTTQVLVINSIHDDSGIVIYNWKGKVDLSQAFYTGVNLFKQYNWFRGSVWGVIYQKAFLNKKAIRFLPNLTNGEDTLFFLEVQLYANRIAFYDMNFYRVYNRLNSASKNMNLPKLINLGRVVRELEHIKIKEGEKLTTDQHELIEYCKYRVLLQITYCAVRENISYRTILTRIKPNDFLPLLCYPTQRYQHKLKFMLLNKYILFYYLVWMKTKLYR